MNERKKIPQIGRLATKHHMHLKTKVTKSRVRKCKDFWSMENTKNTDQNHILLLLYGSLLFTHLKVILVLLCLIR